MGEPNKAVICSIALARLRTDIKGNELANSNALGMAQKLLLFWRKPARRCWWEGVELENVEGVQGPLKVWIRRVWTLEMVSDFAAPEILLKNSVADANPLQRASSACARRELIKAFGAAYLGLDLAILFLHITFSYTS